MDISLYINTLTSLLFYQTSSQSLLFCRRWWTWWRQDSKKLSGLKMGAWWDAWNSHGSHGFFETRGFLTEKKKYPSTFGMMIFFPKKRHGVGFLKKKSDPKLGNNTKPKNSNDCPFGWFNKNGRLSHHKQLASLKLTAQTAAEKQRVLHSISFLAPLAYFQVLFCC